MSAAGKAGRSAGKIRTQGRAGARSGQGGGLLTPLRLAWLLTLVLICVGAAGFVLAYQQGGPRKGMGVVLDLPPSVQGGGPDLAATAPAPTVAPSPPEPDTAVAETAGPSESAPTEAAVTAGGQARVAVVITGLGLAQGVTEQAVNQLPAAVALSFSPYAPEVTSWIAKAQAKGHEVLLDLPMEPTTYPNDDPGPLALMTHLAPAENLERLNTILSLGQGTVGLVAVMGSRFLASEPHLTPILQEVGRNGLLFLDNHESNDSRAKGLAERIGLAHAASDRALDNALPSREVIESRLLQVERLAFSRGSAIARGRPYPATLELVGKWIGELEARGLSLAPLSQVIALRR